MTRARIWLLFGALISLLGIVFLIYSTGLGGPLILDDIPNLRPLENIGSIDDYNSFFQFILSKSGDYPVRPLSYASFLINDNGWPLYVEGYKYTNVLLHLLNGVLVFWLALLLSRLMALPQRAGHIIALSSTALWLLAPLQVSSVLYVIQRMTELSALFVLCGLITYCYGRLKLNERPIPAFFQMSTGVVVFGILGFLCKENALLLALYLLVLEHTLVAAGNPIRSVPVRICHRTWQLVFLIVPTVTAFGFIVANGVFNGYSNRPFSAFERIASQPRILFDYLQNLLIPSRQGMGLAHDDFVLSTDLLSPPTTLLAILGLAMLIAVAIYSKRKQGTSLLAFAILWFLAGHLLESSIIALEPYFEHRNYLPVFGPFFAISYGVWTTRISLHKYLKLGLAAYVICFALITKLNVDIWSNKALMAETWAAEHPRSVRAQQIRADAWSHVEGSERAHEILSDIASIRWDTMSPQLQRILSVCRTESENVDEHLDELKERIDQTYYDHAVVPTLLSLNQARASKCPELSTEELFSVIEIILNHESVSIRPKAVSDLLYLRAVVLAEEGKVQAAASHLYAAFRKNPDYDIGFNSVKFLSELGAYREALKVLDDIASIDLPAFSPSRFRTKELEQWRDRLENALASGESGPKTSVE